jgi:hypothetical protein
MFRYLWNIEICWDKRNLEFLTTSAFLVSNQTIINDLILSDTFVKSLKLQYQFHEIMDFVEEVIVNNVQLSD